MKSGSKVPWYAIKAGGLWFNHDQTRGIHGVATLRATDRFLQSDEIQLEISAVPKSAPILTKVGILSLRYLIKNH